MEKSLSFAVPALVSSHDLGMYIYIYIYYYIFDNIIIFSIFIDIIN